MNTGRQTGERVDFLKAHVASTTSLPRLVVCPQPQVKPKSTAPSLDPHKFHYGFTPAEARHRYAIETLPRSGWFKSQPYLYTCIRCKWQYRVNDSPGSIIPLDRKGGAITGAAKFDRIDTFVDGPCPAFHGAIIRQVRRPSRAGWFHRLAAALSLV